MMIQQFPDHIITMPELKEYKELQNNIFVGEESFIELDMNNQDHVRLNELTPKYLAFKKWIKHNAYKQNV